MTAEMRGRAPGDHDRSIENIPLLNGLRGLAALIVFVSHAAIIGFLPAPLGHGFGQVGVMIFFVLSGFLMGHLYLRRAFTGGNLKAYALARAGRVAPLYFAVVAMSVVIYNFVYPEFRYALDLHDLRQLLEALLLIRAPYELWTIPVEVQFYAVFPVFWLLYTRGWRFRLIPLAALVSLPTVLTIALFGEKLIMLPTFSFAFFMGLFTAVYFDQIKLLVLDKLPQAGGILFLLLVLVNLPELRMEHGLAFSRTQYWVAIWLDPVTWFFVYGLFLCCVAGARSLDVLKSPAFGFLGQISYGFYLFHYPVLMIVADVIGRGPVGLILGLATTVLLSAASYSYFEKPVMIWVRGFAAPRRN